MRHTTVTNAAIRPNVWHSRVSRGGLWNFDMDESWPLQQAHVLQRNLEAHAGSRAAPHPPMRAQTCTTMRPTRRHRAWAQVATSALLDPSRGPFPRTAHAGWPLDVPQCLPNAPQSASACIVYKEVTSQPALGLASFSTDNNLLTAHHCTDALHSGKWSQLLAVRCC